MDTLQEYKCPNCGGILEFDSSLQKMKCPYCDSEFEMEMLKALDEGIAAERPDEMVWNTDAGSQWADGEADGMRVYVCRSCGGEIAADETTAASTCPYCGNNITMTGNLSGSLRPDYVIPFKLDKKAAKNALMRHIGGKRLLPKVFRTQNHIDEIKGVYVPFWMFDADAEADIRFRAEKTRTWSDSQYNYLETEEYSAYRSGTFSFANIPADGSSKMPDELMESLEPFYMDQAVDFQTAYLSGYLADKYDVTAEDCVPRINERAKRSTETAFAATVTGYNSVRAEVSSVRLTNGKAKYVLIPVWLLYTKWQGKKYTFAMNGQTGKFVGDLPLDKKLYWRWLIGLSAGITLGLYGIMQLLFSL